MGKKCGRFLATPDTFFAVSQTELSIWFGNSGFFISLLCMTQILWQMCWEILFVWRSVKDCSERQGSKTECDFFMKYISRFHKRCKWWPTGNHYSWSLVIIVYWFDFLLLWTFWEPLNWIWNFGIFISHKLSRPTPPHQVVNCQNQDKKARPDQSCHWRLRKKYLQFPKRSDWRVFKEFY